MKEVYSYLLNSPVLPYVKFSVYQLAEEGYLVEVYGSSVDINYYYRPGLSGVMTLIQEKTMENESGQTKTSTDNPTTPSEWDKILDEKKVDTK